MPMPHLPGVRAKVLIAVTALGPGAAGLVAAEVPASARTRADAAPAASSACPWVGSNAPVSSRVDQLLPKGSTTDGTQLQLYTCNGTAGQSWVSPAAGVSGPTGQVTGISDLCVDMKAASNADRTPVQTYTCNGTAAQQWNLPS